MRPAMSVFPLLVVLIATRTKASRLLLEEDTAVSVLQGGAPESRNFIQEGSGAETIRKLLDNVTAISKSKDTSEIGLQVAAAAMPPSDRKKPETYPDILDIAGMDYSPAKRRTPIHN